MSDGLKRSVVCRDAFDRPAEIKTAIDSGAAVLTAPPGETARMSTRQLSDLIDALNEVRNELYRSES